MERPGKGFGYKTFHQFLLSTNTTLQLLTTLPKIHMKTAMSICKGRNASSHLKTYILAIVVLAVLNLGVERTTMTFTLDAAPIAQMNAQLAGAMEQSTAPSVLVSRQINNKRSLGRDVQPILQAAQPLANGVVKGAATLGDQFARAAGAAGETVSQAIAGAGDVVQGRLQGAAGNAEQVSERAGQTIQALDNNQGAFGSITKALGYRYKYNCECHRRFPLPTFLSQVTVASRSLNTFFFELAAISMTIELW